MSRKFVLNYSPFGTVDKNDVNPILQKHIVYSNNLCFKWWTIIMNWNHSSLHNSQSLTPWRESHRLTTRSSKHKFPRLNVVSVVILPWIYKCHSENRSKCGNCSNCGLCALSRNIVVSVVILPWIYKCLLVVVNVVSHITIIFVFSEWTGYWLWSLTLTLWSLLLSD
jgi:hypothetical protein